MQPKSNSLVDILKAVVKSIFIFSYAIGKQVGLYFIGRSKKKKEKKLMRELALMMPAVTMDLRADEKRRRIFTHVTKHARVRVSTVHRDKYGRSCSARDACFNQIRPNLA